MNEYLESQGIRITRGTIVHATTIQAPSLTKNAEHLATGSEEVGAVRPNLTAARVDTQFKPGKSGNPSGPPNGIASDQTFRLAVTTHPNDPDRQTFLDRTCRCGAAGATAVASAASRRG